MYTGTEILPRSGGGGGRKARAVCDANAPDRVELRSDATTAWASREIESRTAMQIQRVLWPSPMASSLASFAGTLFKQNALNVAQLFGYPPTGSSRGEGGGGAGVQLEAAKKAVNRSQQQPMTKQPGSVTDPSAVDAAASQKSAETTKTPDNGPESKDTVTGRGNAPSSPASTANSSELGKSIRAKDVFPYETVSSNLDGAWKAFKKTFSEKWADPQRPASQRVHPRLGPHRAGNQGGLYHHRRGRLVEPQGQRRTTSGLWF